MAGKKGRSGRKKIPEGAKKQKDGEMFYRKNSRWIRIKNETAPEPEKEADKSNISDKSQAGADENGKAESGENVDRNDIPENDLRNETEPLEVKTSEQLDDSAGLGRDFAEMEALLDGVPEAGNEASTGLQAPDPDWEQDGDGGNSHTISGEMLLRILDFGGRFAGSLILQKYFDKNISRNDLKMTAEEREELQEFADAAAATINFKAAGNPWVSLIVAYAIIMAMKIEDA